MDFSLCEKDLSAIFLDDALFCPNIAGHIVLSTGILLPLRIDIRLHEVDNLMNGDSLTQENIVYHLKTCQESHPLTIIEIGASRAFVDILCSSHRDNKDIALFFCFFQMLDMPIVQEIKDTVTKHNLLARIAKRLSQLQKIFFADDFFVRHARFPQFPRYLNQSAVAS